MKHDRPNSVPSGSHFLVLTALLIAVPAAAATIIGHTDVDQVAALPQATMDAIGQQKWLFTHASVGANMIEGMETLHSATPGRYQLITAAAGTGSSVSAPPATTVPGTVYDAPRGNPGWQQKFAMFDNAVRTLGWRSPKVDVAMDKLCYIDQDANPTNYVAMMTALEADFPATVFVYATMPLERDGSADWANILRTDYNNVVRTHCQANNRVLFDIADIESHDPSGNAITFTNAGKLYQRMYSGYTTDGGHLNTLGEQRVALGWYATAAAIAAASTTPQWTTNNLPAGLIAWWQGEGNLLDSAGAHAGSGSTAPTYASGRFGQAFQFNGTDQSVMIPDGHADLDGWTQFTLEAWVNFDSLRDSPGPGQAVISKVGNHRGPYSGNFGYQFGFGNTATKLFCQFNTDTLLWPGYQTMVDVPFAIATNVWYHVATTYDHNAVKLYLNGVPLITNIVGPVTIANTVSTLRISKDDNENVAFAGRIDDARIYNRALTATEIGRLALGLPEANGVWGLKTHDPLSQPPTTMFYFDENGANYREIGRVTLAGADIEADGLAVSPSGGLYAFQVNAPGGSRLLALNSTSAVASVIGPVLSGRNIRGAAFTLSGRLLAFDHTLRELLEVSPVTGQQIGAAVTLSTNLNATSTAGDLTQLPDGSLVFAYHEFLYRLDPRTGAMALLHEDKVALADNFVPYCCGVVCVPGSAPANKLFCYEASQHDDVYQYLPSTAFARAQLLDNVVPAYNAGRGDLAALPAAGLEFLNFSVSGTNATIEAVCRGGVTAWVEFKDDLSAPDWQAVPGTKGFIPYSDGSIATPKTWVNLPATSQQRFFRIATQ